VGKEFDDAVTRRLVDFVERTGDLVGVVDENGRVLYLNQTARKVLGVGDADDLTTADLFTAEAFETYFADARPELLRSGSWTGELGLRTPAGGPPSLRFSIVAGTRPGGEVTGLVAHARLTEHAPDDAAALRDASSVHARLAAALERGGKVAVVYAAVTGIRDADDGLLRAAGQRLALAVPTSDYVARVGRDTFVLLFHGVKDFAEVLRLAETLQATFEREPIAAPAADVRLGLALGLALGEPDDDADDLLRRAQAGVVGSRSSRPRIVVDPEEVALTEACEALRFATSHGDVQTRLRPVIDLSGEDPHAGVVAYEAFARWNHRTVGTIEGHDLYELAARATVGLAIDLRALREAAPVVADTPGGLDLYASISEQLLDDVSAARYVDGIAATSEMATDRMHLFVDERLVPLRGMHDALRSLRDAGCRMAVGGVNPSSDVVALVGDFHFRELILPGDAIPARTTSRVALRWVDAVIGIAHDAGARVVLQGVHTAARHELARTLGFDAAIGDFYGRSVAIA
jgi:predicted signal transduction protein with EAL and GGDEF domain